MANPKITISQLNQMMPTLLATPKFQALGLVAAPGVGKTHYFLHELPALLAESRGVTTDDIGVVVEKVGQREDAPAVCGLTLPGKDASGALITTGSKPYLLQRIESTGKQHGIILFDEALQAPADIQKALSDAFNVDEHKLGDWPLPEGWVVVFTGNRAQDKSGSGRLLSHLRNGRALVFELDFNFADWKRWAIDHDVNPLVIDCAEAWIYEGFFADAVPTEDGAFCTPRSLVRASDHLTAFMNSGDYDGGALPVWMDMLLEANIGYTSARTLSRHIGMADEVPSFDEIMVNPEGVKVPDSTGYQLLAGNRAISGCTTAEQGERALRYIVRLRPDLQVTLGCKLLDVSSTNDWTLTTALAGQFIAKFTDLIPLAESAGWR